MLKKHRITFITSSFGSEVFNFVFCGITSAALYFIVLYVMDSVFQFPLAVNFTTAYIISSTYNFAYNKIITFDAGKAKIVKHGLGYLLMLTISYFSNLLVIEFLVFRASLGIYSASIVAIIVNTVFRFFASKHLVYR